MTSAGAWWAGIIKEFPQAVKWFKMVIQELGCNLAIKYALISSPSHIGPLLQHQIARHDVHFMRNLTIPDLGLDQICGRQSRLPINTKILSLANQGAKFLNGGQANNSQGTGAPLQLWAVGSAEVPC